jgi:hypothetical protein
MPTGYTSKIADGTIVKFDDFVLLCARAFLPMMRERPESVSIPKKFRVSNYHKIQLSKAIERRTQLDSMDNNTVEVQCKRDYDKELSDWEEYEDERIKKENRYNAMLQEVKNWSPPTSEHINIKSFMIEQLTTSRDYDCLVRPKPVLQNSSQWLISQIAKVVWDIKYHTKECKEEIGAVNIMNKWIKELRQSLLKNNRN